MFRVILTIFIAAIAIAGYFVFYQDADFLKPSNTAKTQPTPTDTDTVPATTETVAVKVPPATEKQATVDVAEQKLSAAQKEQAKEHVASITNKEQEPLEITKADHFVTADQILQLPELKAPEIAKIESTNTESALIVSAPSETTANLTDTQKNVENAATAQSFAVKISTFNKPAVVAAKAETVKPATLPAEALKPESEKPKSLKPSKTEQTKAESQKTFTTEAGSVASTTIVTTPSTPTISTTANTVTALPAADAIDTNPVNEKVLGTVTGTREAEPITLTSKSVKTIVITDNLKEEAEKASVITTIKDNLEQLSDIKLSELNQIVDGKTDQQPAAVTTEQAVETTSTSNLVKTELASSQPDVAVPNSVNRKVAENLSENNRIKLRELLSDTESDTKRIFYLHAVDATDEQGIWGIIQQGLMGTFSKGITLSQANGEVKALIPQDADEVLDSKQSSFLGKLLDSKVLTTYVYNYEQGYIGKNPDIIQPGQQLIIVTFTENELMSVYQHFRNQQQ